MSEKIRSRPSPRRVLAGIALAIAALAAVAQLLLPGYLAGRVEDRLTDGGGHAEVSMHAFPSLRLLGSDGSSLRIRANGLRLPLPREPRFLERLDGFDRVDITLDRIRTGPFDTRSFRLARAPDSSRYRLELHSSAAAGELGGVAGGSVAGPLGAIAGALAGDALGGGDEAVPIDIDASFESEGGNMRALQGGGTVGGLPVGPLIELFGGVIASQL